MVNIIKISSMCLLKWEMSMDFFKCNEMMPIFDIMSKYSEFG